MLKLNSQATNFTAGPLCTTLAATLVAFFAFSLLSEAGAFHYPWDQGHDTTDWNDPDNPGPCEGPNCDPCKSTGSPVYIPTGHLVWTETDIGFSGRPPISISRTYNSNDPRRGMFGNGWTTGCDMRLVPVVTSVENPATMTQELVTDYVLPFGNGKRFVYVTDRSVLPVPPGAPVISPPGRFDEVVPQGDGTNHLIDESGAVTVFGADGQLLTSSEPTGQLLTNTYDAQGRLSQVADNNSRFVNLTYNASGLVSSITDHGGRTWNYTYDANGNLTQVDDPTGGARLYAYSAYSPVGDGNTYYQMTSIADAAGVVLASFTYINDRVVAHTAGQNTHSYTYNDTTRQVTKADSAGSQWVFTYDTDQVISQIRDPLGSTESFQYDPNGQLTQYTDYLGNTWSSTYDAAGRRLSTTNPLNETSNWSYQADNPRPSTLTSTTGRTTQLAYDAQGSLTQITDATGSVATLSYSAQGEVSSIANSLNNQIGIVYNSIGLPQSTTDAVGRVTGFGYDPVGNVVNIQNDDGDQYQFAYDNLNRLTAISGPSGQAITFGRDVAGRVTSMTDPASNTTQNQWDSFGRLAARTFADGRVQSIGRRNDNLIESITAPDGLVTTYQYDAAKNVTRIDAGGEVTTFAYDANYQLIQASNATGIVDIVYDALGRTVSETTNGQAVTYQYDAEGQRTSMVSPTGTTTYSYDDRGLITRIAAPEGDYDFGYDALGRRAQVSYPNGVTSTWGYNAADQLISLSYGGAFNASFGLSHGANGLISGLTGDGANWAYQYDDDGALIQATHGVDTFNYSYDPAGNHIGDGQVVDSANRLVEDTLFDYVYDARGNLLSKSANDGSSRVEYQWNNYNKLTSYQSFPSTDPSAIPDKVIEYSYGPLGRMWSRTEDGVEDRYVYDRGERIITLDSTDAIVESVTYGTSVDEPLSIDNAQGRRYVHAGINGSVVALTDGAGVTDTYSYDPFGVTTVDSGSYGNAFRYTGRQYETDDLYYYRSRFYDPTTRRYLSEDPAGFVVGELNLYRYVGNNPVNFADPSGEIWPAVLVVWGAVEVGLAIYDAYDTYNTVTDPCTGTWEKVFAGTLFVAGAALPGGGYSKADDVIKAADNYVDDVVDLADEGVIYRVPGSATDSGKPYIGRSDDLQQRTRNARDGRDRTQAEVIDTYPKGDVDAARAAEQRAINENGGVPNLDNKRNEIAPSKWGDFGIGD